MKILIKLKTEENYRELPGLEDPESPNVVVPNMKCPYCGVAEFRVAGNGMHPSADDRAYEADAGCVKCKAHVGTLRAEMNTLFGVREDMAVTSGRFRVY